MSMSGDDEEPRFAITFGRIIQDNLREPKTQHDGTLFIELQNIRHNNEMPLNDNKNDINYNRLKSIIKLINSSENKTVFIIGNLAEPSLFIYLVNVFINDKKYKIRTTINIKKQELEISIDNYIYYFYKYETHIINFSEQYIINKKNTTPIIPKITENKINYANLSPEIQAEFKNIITPGNVPEKIAVFSPNPPSGGKKRNNKTHRRRRRRSKKCHRKTHKNKCRSK